MSRLGVASAVVDGQLVLGDIDVRDHAIAAVGVASLAHDGAVLTDELVALPGLVDLQVNGFVGVDLLHADEAGWRAVAIALARQGVTSYLATLITASPTATASALAVATAVRARPGPGESCLLGVHLEGPFLSPQRAGTHPRQHLQLPDLDVVRGWLTSGVVRLVTLAPELPGALDAVGLLRSAGVQVSLGHSACDATVAQLGFDADARAVTHVFNAMAPISSRAPGLAGAALARPDITVCAIADGVHLAPELLAIARQCAAGRLALVSDVTAAGAMPDGSYELGDVPITVTDGVVRRADGVLAGSGRSLAYALQVTRAAGWSWQEIADTTSGAAQRLVPSQRSSLLRPGDPADVVVVDATGVVQHVLVGGVDVGP